MTTGRVFGVMQHHLQYDGIKGRVWPAAAGTCRPDGRRNAHSPGRPAWRGPAPAWISTRRYRAPARTRGASNSSTLPVPVPISSRRPPSPGGTSESRAASTAAAGRSRARISSQSAPLSRKLSEAIRARSASTRAAWRRSASSTGSCAASGQPAHAPAHRHRQRQGKPDVGTLTHPVQQPAIAQQLQMA